MVIRVLIGWGTSIDPSVNVFVAGYAGSLIATPGAHQMTYAGGTYDAFVAKFADGSVGVSENNTMSDESVFPNPSNGHFTITVSEESMAACQV